MLACGPVSNASAGAATDANENTATNAATSSLLIAACLAR